MGSMLDREKRPIPNVLTDGLIPETPVQQEGETRLYTYSSM
jgi:hypothetical protein